MAMIRGTCFPTTKSLLQAGRQSSGNRRLFVATAGEQAAEGVMATQYIHRKDLQPSPALGRTAAGTEHLKP